MMYNVNLSPNEQTGIGFQHGKIVTRIILGFAFLAFVSFCLFQSDNSIKPIFLFLILVSLHIIVIHGLRHLIQHNNAKLGLAFDKKGITNNTADTSVFIPWTEIEDFQTGFYRANQQIFVKVSNPDKYHQLRRSAYLTFINRIGKFFRSKPDLLWIDVNLLDINEKHLLNLLHSKLEESRAD
ncbi:STM3941 family protein [Pedobacter xixiisoli]|uniref:Uncharacterized protein n=1 Tax=Pedobacter xixiisoli TaxID=1476464 RepID=A0A286A047_9SPHI|nr:STM3941 family protein [Pedobacter xixiisoli]SOD15258.1 hypothetical protein SAMN06297358_2239 [Pedobacter xixiisoli]